MSAVAKQLINNTVFPTIHYNNGNVIPSPKTTHSSTALHSGCNPLILKISHVDPLRSTYTLMHTLHEGFMIISLPLMDDYTRICAEREI